MRESVGAAWIMSVCLSFIMLFTAYIAISVNYSRAFQVKNHIISMIEENEGVKDTAGGDIEFKKKLMTYLSSVNQNSTGTCPDKIKDGDTTWVEVQDSRINRVTNRTISTTSNTNSDVFNNAANVGDKCIAAIYKVASDTKENNPTCANYAKYRVIVFFDIDLPIVNTFGSIRVTGDTNSILDFSNSTCGANKNVTDIKRS